MTATVSDQAAREQIRTDQQLPYRRSFGFREGDRGTHTSRTIMLAELRILLDHNPPTAAKSDYWRTIVEDNVLGKRTGSTRRLSAQRLSELYGLDPAIPIFRTFRLLWNMDEAGRPLLAFLCAYARDPLLRLTAPAILNARQGESVTTAAIEKALIEVISGRFNPSILNKIARNAGSSWTQSGHLSGRAHKVRSRPVATPANTAFALFLGYLEGFRAQRLFATEWARLLDRAPEQLSELASIASQRGLLNYRNVGSVVEVRFPDLLTTEEEERLREQG